MKGLGFTRLLKIMGEFRSAKSDMQTCGQIGGVKGWRGVGKWACCFTEFEDFLC